MESPSLPIDVDEERVLEHDLEEEIDLFMASLRPGASARLEQFVSDDLQRMQDFADGEKSFLQAFDEENTRMREEFEDKTRERVCKFNEKQEEFEQKMRERVREFKEKQERLSNHFKINQKIKKRAFDYAEERLQARYKRRFCDQLLKHGVSSTRRLARPAYVFERFSQFPKELQIQIWTMAICDKSTAVHVVGDDAGINNYAGFPRNVSSTIMSDIFPVPTELHVCRLSREVAQTMYSCLPSLEFDIQACEENPFRQAYFDIVNDEFYIPWDLRPNDHDNWRHHQIIIDILVKHHGSEAQWQSLPETLRQHIDKLLQIRNLRIDLRVFRCTPPRVWAYFSKLNCLTIMVPPTVEAEIVDHEDYVKPKNGTKYGKRENWIWGYVYKMLSGIEKDFPAWKYPNIKVRLYKYQEHDYRTVFEEASPEEYDEVRPDPPPGDPLHTPFLNRLERMALLLNQPANPGSRELYNDMPSEEEMDEDDLEWFREMRFPTFEKSVTKFLMLNFRRWPFDEHSDSG